MTDYLTIYRDHAAAYDKLVSAEDCDHQLLPAIERLCPLASASVLEVGTGTGRISRLLVGQGARLVGFDFSPAMLAVAHDHLGNSAALAQADARNLPLAPRWADLAIAGWVFGHMTRWFSDRWQSTIGQALDEMARVLKPGAAQIVIETLGTGRTEPAAPNEALAAYYSWLESVRGFQRVTLRTDLCFDDVEQAAQLTGFFFGSAFADQVRQQRWSRVPECTGLWWKRL